jgi:photosystem II stability/assembly factor-like uncharacterized protein
MLGLAWQSPLAAADFDPKDTASWRMPNPDLYDVEARGDSVWAAGYWGTVLRSSDRGRTWSYARTPTQRTLYAVSFADERHGWVVGAGGVLMRSTDAGASWRRQTVHITDEFGDILELDSDLFGVAALSPTEAFAVGDFGTLLRTRDGKNWQQVPIEEEVFADENLPDRILNGIYFSDRQHGWIAGEFGTILRTVDGGETWLGERHIEGTFDEIYLFDVASEGADHALAVGTGGIVIGTSDGGALWTALDVGTSAGVFGVARSRGRGIAVGDRGVLLVTLDDGASWFEPERPRGFNWLRGATYGRDDDAFVVGESGLVLRSSDGGKTWSGSAGREPPPSQGVSVPEPASDLPGRQDEGRDG